MKKILLGCTLAMCGLSGHYATAQDFCSLPQCDPCCIVSDFNGLYLGGNVGAVTHTAHRNDLNGFLIDLSGWTTNNTSVTAGIQLGYDWQCCNSLFGIVADWNWANTRNKVPSGPHLEGTIDSNIQSHIDWFTTIRARAGLTICDALFYVTGGAAVTRIQSRWNEEVSGDFEIHNDFRYRQTRWGWTGGVGSEFKLGCNWSLGLELLYLHFDDSKRSFTVTGGFPEGATFQFGASDSVWLGRVTLNYRFGDLCGRFF